MQTKDETLWELFKCFQTEGVTFAEFIKAFTEFRLLYQTPQGFSCMPVGHEGEGVVAIGFFPGNLNLFPDITSDLFMLFDETVVTEENLKDINRKALFTKNLWHYVYRNMENINTMLKKLNKPLLQGSYLGSVKCAKGLYGLFDCIMEAWRGTHSMKNFPYPPSIGESLIKFRIGGIFRDGKIYTIDGTEELHLLKTGSEPSPQDFPFDLLCTSDDGRRMFRLPYAEGKDQNPIAIFFSKENPRLYMELKEFDNGLRSNLDDSRLPPYQICEMIWCMSKKLNPCLRALGKPELKGCYFSQMGNSKMNWIVRLNSAEGGACMPSDYYDTNERAKGRYIGEF